jgi:hypothetical protein
MPITIVAMILRYLESRRRDSIAGPDNLERSLTTSELQEMIEESVQRAIAPVNDHILSIDRELQEVKALVPDSTSSGIRKLEVGPEDDQPDLKLRQGKSLGRTRVD